MSINNGTTVTSLGFVYDLGGQVIGFTTPTAEYFYLKDILGNILGLIDKNGLYVVKYTYDIWGKVLSTDVINTTDTAIALNPFKYKGYFYDDETGWYYLKSRYYDPSLGRFISPDDSAQITALSTSGLNLYAYCGNNPISRVDSNGHSWFDTLYEKACKAADFVYNAVNTALGTVNPVSKGTAIATLAVAASQGRWAEIKEDYESGALNLFNQDESVANGANVVGFYKGSTVVKHNFEGTCSILGTIWYSRDNENRTDYATIFKHEFGHSVQERLLGNKYLFTIAIPSALYCLAANENSKLADGYYSTPWERTADLFGGVSRDNHKANSLNWAILENTIGPLVIPFYFAFGF